MNKFLPFFILGFLCSFNLQSQHQRTISVNYNLLQSELLRTVTLDGAGSYTNNNDYEIGIRFNQELSDKTSIESGLDFFKAKVQISSNDPSIETREEVLQLMSIPLVVHYDVYKNYFLSSGVLINIQNKKTSFDSQSGLGFTLGIGRKIYVQDFFFIINPKLDINAVVPFKKENHHQRLAEAGIRLGLGYTF